MGELRLLSCTSIVLVHKIIHHLIMICFLLLFNGSSLTFLTSCSLLPWGSKHVTCCSKNTSLSTLEVNWFHLVSLIVRPSFYISLIFSVSGLLTTRSMMSWISGCLTLHILCLILWFLHFLSMIHIVYLNSCEECAISRHHSTWDLFWTTGTLKHPSIILCWRRNYLML